MTLRHCACILTCATLANTCAAGAADSIPPAPPGDAKAFVISIDVYRVQTDALDKVTLRAPGATLKSEAQGDTPNPGTSPGAKARFSMTFSEAEFTAKGLTLRATADSWTWNGKPEPPPGTAVEKIAGGAAAAAFWIDPRTGERTAIGTFPAQGVRAFTTPEGWEDALLILEAAAK